MNPGDRKEGKTMTINIESESENLEKLKERLSETPENIIEKAVIAVLDFEKCPYECSVEVLFTDDENIREINREQREIDRSTDVLSFPMIDFETPSFFDGFDDRGELFDPESGELILGDIVLSVEHIMAQASEYGHSCDRELAFLVAHSMLHLLGYDHMEEDERKTMEEKQRLILDAAGYHR